MVKDTLFYILKQRRALSREPVHFRSTLKTVLMREYQSISQTSSFRLTKEAFPRWRIVSGLSIGALCVVLSVLFNTPTPIIDPGADENKVIAAVMNSPEIKAALLGDEIGEVTISGTLNTATKVTIKTVKGHVYTALLNQQDQIIAVNPDIPTLGYGFYPTLTLPESYPFTNYENQPFALTLEEKTRTLGIAGLTNPTRDLLEKGATISRVALAYVKTTTVFDIDNKIWTAVVHEKLAQILVQLEDQHWVFFIDYVGGEIFISLDDFCRNRGIPNPANLPRPTDSGEYPILIEINQRQ